MKRKGPYIQAFILLVVFSLNSTIASACSLGAFLHDTHHRAVDVHHHSTQAHSHTGNAGLHSHDDTKHGSTPANCCQAFVAALDQVDKTTAKSIELSPPGFSSLYYLNIFLASIAPSINLPGKNDAPFGRWRVPSTIHDLRILMQSFQI